MLRIEIIATGKLRPGPLADLWAEYAKRLGWPLNLLEIDGKNTADEHQKILARINPRAYVIAMDERGKSVGSVDFARKLDDLAAAGQNNVQFIIGGADGLSEDIRKRANFLLSFGKQTWPHLMARIMLLEQVYRSQQILAGHPYHRE